MDVKEADQVKANIKWNRQIDPDNFKSVQFTIEVIMQNL